MQIRTQHVLALLGAACTVGVACVLWCFQPSRLLAPIQVESQEGGVCCGVGWRVSYSVFQPVRLLAPTQVESQGGGVERGSARLQQDLEGAVREGLPQVPGPPGGQLQAERHEGPSLKEPSERDRECL